MAVPVFMSLAEELLDLCIIVLDLFLFVPHQGCTNMADLIVFALYILFDVAQDNRFQL
jgi:hypothetical protein